MDIANNKAPEKKKRRKKKKRPPHKSKMVTGYIIYASEIRKEVIKKYPDRDFGDISKLVGIEWKNLPQETKVAYEKRAQEQNAKSKEDAAKHFELKKLADAAEERANREHAALVQNQHGVTSSSQLSLPTTATTCNGYATTNGHNQSITSNHQLTPQQLLSQQTIISISQQTNVTNSSTAPLHIIQRQQQPIATNIQYYGNNQIPRTPTLQGQQQETSCSLNFSQTPQLQYQRNNIVYRKPATVRLRPKEATTQTDPINWLNSKPKKPLRFSQKFIDYLNGGQNAINNNNNIDNNNDEAIPMNQPHLKTNGDINSGLSSCNNIQHETNGASNSSAV